MKTLFKWASLVCLSYSALHAGTYLTAVKASNGKYLCAEEGGGYGLNANRSALGPWETFIMEDLAPETPLIEANEPMAFRAESTNLYWCAPTDPYVLVNRVVRGPWETFYPYGGPINDGSVVYIKTYLGGFSYCWLRANTGYGHVPLSRGGLTISQTEHRFTFIILAYMPDPAP